MLSIWIKKLKSFFAWIRSHGDEIDVKEFFGKLYYFAKDITAKQMTNHGYNYNACKMLIKSNRLKIKYNYYMYNVLNCLTKIPVVGKCFKEAKDRAAISVIYITGATEAYREMIEKHKDKF